MAVCESIKRAMEALEKECAAAQCTADALMLATGDEPSPAWVDLHHLAVMRLVNLADELVCAITRSEA